MQCNLAAVDQLPRGLALLMAEADSAEWVVPYFVEVGLAECHDSYVDYPFRAVGLVVVAACPFHVLAEWAVAFPALVVVACDVTFQFLAVVVMTMGRQYHGFAFVVVAFLFQLFAVAYLEEALHLVDDLVALRLQDLLQVVPGQKGPHWLADYSQTA